MELIFLSNFDQPTGFRKLYYSSSRDYLTLLYVNMTGTNANVKNKKLNAIPKNPLELTSSDPEFVLVSVGNAGGDVQVSGSVTQIFITQGD